ncbi:Uso1 [Symbiodinium natans]|uniref:Uso1 protein n=1 Tax=Symbiodinium natans TaxID=878477 RepID=A0A812LXQ8_9DINO|nr:Uso1 [Symbiodinium natans]
MSLCTWASDDSDSDCDEVRFDGQIPQPPVYRLLDAAVPDQKVAYIPGFLAAKDISRIHRTAQREDVKVVNDRDDSLVYKHEVWRIEFALKEDCPEVYHRLMKTAWAGRSRAALDAELGWQGIDEGKTVLFPEIEYIVYDVKQLKAPGSIQRHRDNGSRVTAVVLLSDPRAFQGGVNCFDGEFDEPSRSLKLGFGDAVFFYGDRLLTHYRPTLFCPLYIPDDSSPRNLSGCYHWITDVVWGRRVVLQMELSQAEPCECTLLDFLGFCR